MSPASKDGSDQPVRPRVEGERELEILDATVQILAEVGYDLLTMDAVATRAKASKATLYRRWNGKPALVLDAILSQKERHDLPDTGSLRGDLLALTCGMGGLTDGTQVAILGSLITAVSRDREFADIFHRDFIGPKAEQNRQVFVRAQERGEIPRDLDLDVLVPALPAIILHRLFLLGDPPTEELITRVIDQVILPAVHHRGTPTPEPEGTR
ncbi:TetR/AcrR family transcriptional regulator [Nocardioides sp. YIM 152588]|uniref:TetR/AcrR family transcriptional regulator n=1 Tax=Nocardioides sp. YIM 152588 TaxID=3158259 RepID=UPI0032E43323